jgi:hypothetical protein
MFVAPLETPWGVKPQQPERSPATVSTWRRDADEDMAAFTAAVDTPGWQTSCSTSVWSAVCCNWHSALGRIPRCLLLPWRRTCRRLVPKIMLCCWTLCGTWEALQAVELRTNGRGNHLDSGVMPTLLHAQTLGKAP